MSKENSYTLNKIKKFRRDSLQELLSQCTPDQISIFNRMYKSIDDIPDEKIDWAIQQCENTINIKENLLRMHLPDSPK